MEVAEHLPEAVAGKYVRLLCKLAPVVICSAAHPGQGGVDHVNLKPKQYWIDLFAGEGYRLDRDATDALAKEWAQENVILYYHENLMVFRLR